MNPITLPTSPEKRAGLEAIDWKFGRTTDAGVEVWHNHPDDADGAWFELLIYPSERDPLIVDGCSDGDEPVPLRLAVATAGALGFHPPGYRIIPEETATNYLAARTTFFGQKVDGDPTATMENWTRYEDAEEALAVALGGARLLPPHHTPIHEQAAAIQTEGRPVWPVGDGKPPSPLPADDPLPVLPPLEYPPRPQPSEGGGLSPSPLALLKSLYACAVNGAKVEPELERQIRQAIGENGATEL